MKNGAKEYYDRLGEYWDAMGTDPAWHKSQVIFVDRWCKKLKLPKKVLDIACGTGDHLKYFQRLGYRCRGLDQSEGMLKVARKKLPSVKFEKQSFQKFKIEEKLPLITCFSSMTHNPSKGEFCQTLRRVRASLLKGGVFIFEIPEAGSYKKKFLVNKYKKGKIEFSRNFIGIPKGGKFISHSFFVFFDGQKVDFVRKDVIAGRYYEKEVKAMLAKEKFELLYSGPGIKNHHDRLFYIAQKI